MSNTNGLKRYEVLKNNLGNQDYRDTGTARAVNAYTTNEKDNGVNRFVSSVLAGITILSDTGESISNVGQISIYGSEIVYSIVNTSRNDVVFGSNAVSVLQTDNVNVAVVSQPQTVLSGQSTSFTVSVVPLTVAAFSYTLQVSSSSGSTSLTASGTAYTPVAPGNYTDNFADLSAWTVENGGGSVTASGNELIFAGTSGEYNRIHRQTSDVAPATWSTITIECEVWLTSGVSDNDFGIGLCMDDPPTGQPYPWSSPTNLMQDGYGCLFRPWAWSDPVSRFAAGVLTNLLTINETILAGGAWKPVIVTFTKLVDRIRIDRTYDGSSLTQVDDTDASRQTGACTVVLYGNALGGNLVKMRNLVVTAT